MIQMVTVSSLSIGNLISSFPGGIAQGLIWGIMALGVYITFRMLDIADLTVDGSFTTGGAVAAMAILGGMNPWLALLLAFLAGLCAGTVTGLLHTLLGIPAILAGILTQFALYSINLAVMGFASNKAIGVDTYALSISSRYIVLAILTGAVIALVLIGLLYWYFGTESGSAMRATGNNPEMSKAQGININIMKVFGLALSNGVVAFAGALMAQYQGFADINMGRGSIVIGLAAVIIGEVIGGNGAGKSTMLNAIAGVWPIDTGSIVINGQEVTGLADFQRAYLIGRVFQDPMMGTAPDMQIAENLALAARRGKHRTLRWGVTAKEKEEYRSMLADLHLGLEDRLTQKVGLLSGGQRQALTLLMASLQKPKLLLLDEHTAALDPKTAANVLDTTRTIVQHEHLTALMVTHNMKDAIATGNRLIMMHEGKIIFEVQGEEKKKLTVDDLMRQFQTAAGEEFADDQSLLNQ